LIRLNLSAITEVKYKSKYHESINAIYCCMYQLLPGSGWIHSKSLSSPNPWSRMPAIDEIIWEYCICAGHYSHYL
jgi:hypothetical protein